MYKFSDITRAYLAKETRVYDFKDVHEEHEVYVLCGTYNRHLGNGQLLEKIFSVDFIVGKDVPSTFETGFDFNVVIQGYGEAEVNDSTLWVLKARGGEDVLLLLQSGNGNTDEEFENEIKLWHGAIRAILGEIFA